MRKKYIIAEIIIWTFLLGILFTGIIFLYSKLFVEPNIYTIQFKDIDGITKGSPVRFMGITVGHVRRLKSNNKHIDVQIIVTKKDIKIPNGTVARVEFYGLGGSKSIELMPVKGVIVGAGIVSENNIRINDVVLEATGFVEVIEEIEKFVKGIDKTATIRIFENINKFKNSNIERVNDDINSTAKKIKNSSYDAIKKEKKIQEEIDEFNSNFTNQKK